MLCAPVYIYIRQLSSLRAPTLWFIDLTVATCHIQYTFLSLCQYFSRENGQNTKILEGRHFRIIRKWPPTATGRAKHQYPVILATSTAYTGSPSYGKRHIKECMENFKLSPNAPETQVITTTQVLVEQDELFYYILVHFGDNLNFPIHSFLYMTFPIAWATCADYGPAILLKTFLRYINLCRSRWDAWICDVLYRKSLRAGDCQSSLAVVLMPVAVSCSASEDWQCL